MYTILASSGRCRRQYRMRPVLLARIVETSQTVAATRSRKAKVAALADDPGRGRHRGPRGRHRLSRRLPAPATHRCGLARHRLPAAAGRRAEPDRRRGARGVRAPRRAVRGGLAGDQGRGREGPVGPGDGRRAGLAPRRDHRQRPPGRPRRARPGRPRGRERRAAEGRTPRRDARRRHGADRPGGVRGRGRARRDRARGRPAGAADARLQRARRGRGDGQGRRWTGLDRHQARRHPDPGPQGRRRRGHRHPLARRDHRPAARGRRGGASAPGRAVRARRRGAGPDRRRPAAALPGDRVAHGHGERRPGDAVLLRPAPPRRHQPARPARHRAVGGAHRAGPRAAPHAQRHHRRPRGRRGLRPGRPRPRATRAWS